MNLISTFPVTTVFPSLSLLAAESPRLAVLTHIGRDPDDQQSLIRLMVYENEFEIEAIVANAAGTSGKLKQAVKKPELILEIIGGYEKVWLKHQGHASGWPETNQLRRSVKSGSGEKAAV